MACKTPCRNCDRKGLPILFTRYAAAFSAQDQGMAVLRQLQPTGHFQSKPGGVAMHTALYGVRMLRPGYLYVRLQYAGQANPEWLAYIVHPHGYLAQFDIGFPEAARSNPACEIEVRGANASMVWIRDAKDVTELNYMFHPDPVVPKHLFEQIDPRRDIYMQSFDVAGWAGGNMSQKDSCQPGQLNGQVMEFCALKDPAAQTVGCEQHYGLMGIHGAEREWGNYEEARAGRHFEAVRHERRGADGNVMVTDTGAVGGLADGPYIARITGAPYKDVHGPRLRKMVEFLTEHKGAVVACEDAIGIAQELSLHHLTAATPYVAWLKQVDSTDPGNALVTNAWKHAASESIKTVRSAIYKKAMQLHDSETEHLKQVHEVMGQRHAYPVSTVMVEQKDGSFAEVPVKDREAQRRTALQEEIAARESDRRLVSDAESRAALQKTLGHFDPARLEAFDKAHLAQIKERDTRMDRISEDLIAWLQADAFLVKTLGRYDRKPDGIDTGDGARCAGQLCAILETMDSSPRGRRWYAELQLFKDEPNNLVWRMASLNNEEISQELQRVMDTLRDTLPPATEVHDPQTAEESARQQRAWAAMATALSKIPKTLKGSQTLIKEVYKLGDPGLNTMKKIKSLQKIAKTARENVHAVWAVAVVQAAQKLGASAMELSFAKAQIVLLSHGLGDKAVEFVRNEQRALARKLEDQGRQATYSNKRNPQPDSRAWTRHYDYKGQKMQARVDRALTLVGEDNAVKNMRIPGALGALEIMSLIPTFGRASERGSDPRAGSQSAGAVASAMGTWKGLRSDYYEKNIFEAIKADAPLAARGDLVRAAGEDLRILKVGAAHWVASAAVVGVVWDAIDGGKTRREENYVLAFAYYGRAIAGGVTIGSTLVSAHNLNRVRVVLWCTRINPVTGAITLAASYAIEKLKEKEWTDWLQAQPFRKTDSKKTPHRSEQFMLSQLANAIADMD
ncbi:T6SS effector BTH_I2691 family protein [uncultured Variovorax sp.]|uniref:T6SS effector BTH_I2691 family protein n=1 Tax=uncultured Variovorax sp. TaxID=114708 RepID=UPI0025F77872|nr:T6SS effector BTH_I2691 family protein [uncultured Variovorax sp.]